MKAAEQAAADKAAAQAANKANGVYNGLDMGFATAGGGLALGAFKRP